MLAINKKSALPYYLQLSNILRGQIVSGTFGPDSLLPSERELCESYNVSRSTVRQAIQVLKEDGLIVKERGVGTRVGASHKLEQDLLGHHNFDLQMIQQGHQVAVVMLKDEILTGPGRVQRMMGVPEGERIYKVTRLRTVDEQPVFIEKIYMSLEKYPKLKNEDFRVTDIFLKRLKEEYNTYLGDAKVFIEPVLLDEVEREILEIGDTPAPGLMFERISYSQKGETVAVTKRVFRGDKCRHMLEIQAV